MTGLNRKAAGFILLLVGLQVCAQEGETGPGACHGKFINIVSDICWSCIFPISIGQVSVSAFDMEDYAPDNASSPVCICPAPPPKFYRIGLAVSFWEPVRLADVTKTPLCFTNMGLDLSDSGGYIPAGFNDSDPISGETGSFYHVHWYVFPLLYYLNMLVNSQCRESGSFDLAYITEYDPLWNDDELSLILTPETALFANPIAQAACAADCIAATAHFPRNELFWCAGCQGSLYPFTGNVDAHTGGIQGSLLLTQRMTAKLHRLLVAQETSGDGAVCSPRVAPIIKKTQYKTQITYPIPRTTAPQCCNPYGRSEMNVDPGEEYPVGGEDFGYLIWRKRTCCLSD